MSNTHSEIFPLGDDGSVFIDGIPDKCEHDDLGEGLLFNNSYEYFKESEMPKDENGMENFYKVHGIIGGCTSCSKCGKPSFNSGTMFE